MVSLFSFVINAASDPLLAQHMAQLAAQRLGLDRLQQIVVGALLYRLVRQVGQAAGGGWAELGLDNEQSPAYLLVQVQSAQPLDLEGCGIHLQALAGLFEEAAVETLAEQGSQFKFSLRLPTITQRPSLTSLLNQFSLPPDVSDSLVVDGLNSEVLSLLAQLNRLQQQNVELNSEIESTNRGVVALYAELDDKAEQLRRADELKTYFFSNMSHEFRTPVNSILALSQILLDHLDGDLTSEQTKQVTFIRKAAQDLGDLVNDLLDLIKVEAGRVTIRPSVFDVNDLFSALRGMLRPLASNPAVNLVFEEAPDLPPLNSGEAQVAQVLRNFISNALKFTEKGQVRVSAKLAPDGRDVIFAVADTGIGIAPQDQKRIFEEFTQIENPIQKRVKGTGLGLSLSKRLAELLGGTVALESELGQGSTFTLTIPLHHPSLPPVPVVAGPAANDTFLIIDDDEIARYVLRGYLADFGVELREAANGQLGLELAASLQPKAIFLDLVMPELDGPEVLRRLKANPTTEPIPVIIVTSQVLEEEDRQRLLTQAVAVLSKETNSREAALEQVRAALQRAGAPQLAV